MAMRSVLSRFAGRALTPELRTFAAAQASRSMASKATVNGIPVEVGNFSLILQIYKLDNFLSALIDGICYRSNRFLTFLHSNTGPQP